MKFFLNFIFVLFAGIVGRIHSQPTKIGAGKTEDKAKTKTYKELEIEDYVKYFD
jgi:hypothetical protein